MKLPKVKFSAEFFLISLVVLIAAFFRLYRISDYMTFLGDEGRDVLVAKGILEGHFTLLGPRASAGDFFLGPIYYYFMAPFLWLFKLDPVGPAVMIALIGIATVFLIYKVTKEFFGMRAAIFTSSLYAISPLVVAYSRSSWNPNPMPFVSLLTLYLTYKSVQAPSLKKFGLIGILLGVALQLHYLAVFLILIIGVYILVVDLYLKKRSKSIFKEYLQILFGFLIGFSPFIAFEARHDFPNIRTIVSFVFTNTFQKGYGDNVSFIYIVKDVFFRLFGRLVTSFPPNDHFSWYSPPQISIWQLSTVLLGILSVFFIFSNKSRLIKFLFEIWIFFGILLFGFYKKPIYDYYFGFMFPLPFILVGNFLSRIFDLKNLFFKVLSIGVFVALILVNLSGAPFRFEPNRQKDQVKKISEFVLARTDAKPFNFALITAHNSDHAYRYYFEILGHKPVQIENLVNDPQRKTVTDQLIIICEDVSCHPLGYPMFEVSNFGRAEISGEWDISVVKIFKLVHYRGK